MFHYSGKGVQHIHLYLTETQNKIVIHLFYACTYRYTWSILPVFSGVELFIYFVTLYVLFWLYYVLCYLCLFSMSGLWPWLTFFWYPPESWFPWLFPRPPTYTNPHQMSVTTHCHICYLIHYINKPLIWWPLTSYRGNNEYNYRYISGWIMYIVFNERYLVKIWLWPSVSYNGIFILNVYIRL